MPTNDQLSTLLDELFDGLTNRRGDHACGAHAKCGGDLDVQYSDQGATVHKPLPGISPDDILVTVQGQILCISARGMSGKCSFGVPPAYDIDRITATLNLGMLTVTVPLHPVKNINIQSTAADGEIPATPQNDGSEVAEV